MSLIVICNTLSLSRSYQLIRIEYICEWLFISLNFVYQLSCDSTTKKIEQKNIIESMQTFWTLNKLARLLDWLSPKYVYFALTLFFIFMYYFDLFIVITYYGNIFLCILNDCKFFPFFYWQKFTVDVNFVKYFIKNTNTHIIKNHWYICLLRETYIVTTLLWRAKIEKKINSEFIHNKKQILL